MFAQSNFFVENDLEELVHISCLRIFIKLNPFEAIKLIWKAKVQNFNE